MTPAIPVPARMASIERKQSPTVERKDAELLDEIEEQNEGHVDRKAQYANCSKLH